MSTMRFPSSSNISSSALSVVEGPGGAELSLYTVETAFLSNELTSADLPVLQGYIQFETDKDRGTTDLHLQCQQQRRPRARPLCCLPRFSGLEGGHSGLSHLMSRKNLLHPTMQFCSDRQAWTRMRMRSGRGRLGILDEDFQPMLGLTLSDKYLLYCSRSKTSDSIIQ